MGSGLLWGPDPLLWDGPLCGVSSTALSAWAILKHPPPRTLSDAEGCQKSLQPSPSVPALGSKNHNPRPLLARMTQRGRGPPPSESPPPPTPESAGQEQWYGIVHSATYRALPDLILATGWGGGSKNAVSESPLKSMAARGTSGPVCPGPRGCWGGGNLLSPKPRAVPGKVRQLVTLGHPSDGMTEHFQKAV